MIVSLRPCGRHRKPNSFFALLHFAADGEGHDRKNRSGQPEIAQIGVQAGMSYCINPTVSISSDPSGSGVVPADAALDKAKTVEMAVQSVKTTCGLDKAVPKDVDNNFYIKLLERATRKYESCKRWME